MIPITIPIRKMTKEEVEQVECAFDRGSMCYIIDTVDFDIFVSHLCPPQLLDHDHGTSYALLLH